MGITPKSKVNSLEELNTQITELVLGYHEPVLVEEFISGREFTIAILGNGPEAKALPNLEIVIRGKPVGKKAYLGRYVYSNDVNYVHETDSRSGLGKRVESLALATFHAVDALDLSRVDIRVDEKGNPFVLEINPLPALSKQDAFGILAKLGGKTYDEMLNTIILTAAARYNLV
jgi:D-alanine-D-alanine ligase